MIERHTVLGVEIRVTDVMPKEVIGINNGRYTTLFWEGAEIGRIYPSLLPFTPGDYTVTHPHPVFVPFIQP